MKMIMKSSEPRWPWYIEENRSFDALYDAKATEESKDVIHCAELAIYTIKKGYAVK